MVDAVHPSATVDSEAWGHGTLGYFSGVRICLSGSETMVVGVVLPGYHFGLALEGLDPAINALDSCIWPEVSLVEGWWQRRYDDVRILVACCRDMLYRSKIFIDSILLSLIYLSFVHDIRWCIHSHLLWSRLVTRVVDAWNLTCLSFLVVQINFNIIIYLFVDMWISMVF